MGGLCARHGVRVGTFPELGKPKTIHPAHLPMPALATRLNRLDAATQANRTALLALIDKLNQEQETSRFQGKEKHIAKARSRGQLLARERIELLLDADSPFLELMPLAGWGRKSSVALGSTLLAGIGLVGGVITLICSNVGTVKGGTIDEVTLQKGLRLNEIALQNRLPVIYLVESGGANLPEQAKIFNFGGITFREITRRSKLDIPTIAIVFGNATAGGAYVPGMADYVIMVRERAKVFLAGPPLVKMATQEVADEESLGGAEMHSSISGVSDYLADDEPHALFLARELMAELRHSRPQHTPPAPAEVQPPRFDADELLDIVPADVTQPVDPRELIARIVDGSQFHEFKPDFGTTLVTGYARIHGYEVGILANQGVIFSDSANKGAHFIQLCNRAQKPLLFLQNVTGFMVGTRYEQEGIIKHGAKLINAVSNSDVPAITVMIGASYGAGNYAMCGRAYEPRFVFSYPNAKIAVMGPDQLAGVMDIIQREAAAKAGQPYDEQQAEFIKGMVKQQIETESNAFYATGQLWDDGLIDPRQTRDVLGLSLAVVYNAGFKGTGEFGVFRM